MSHTVPASASVKEIFRDRSRFIIIGLTGRTGSGCTSVASELAKPHFEEIHASEPTHYNFPDDEERKYNIVYNFAKANWSGFQKIEMRDVISTFILKYDLSKFVNWVIELGDKHQIPSTKIQEWKETAGRYTEVHEQYSIVKAKYPLERGSEIAERVIPDNSVREFYFQTLTIFTNWLKDELKNISSNLYTILYQAAANNIRFSGDIYGETYKPESVFALADRANKIIKIWSRYKRSVDGDETPVHFVIDALRNPYEIYYFRYRYSGFYAVSVSTPNEDRIKRLKIDPKSKLTDDQIKLLDQQEYPNESAHKPSGAEKFVWQDIQKCTEVSDIHISNPEDKFFNVKKMILKYVALMLHPGLINPSLQERCMQIAFQARLNSGCISRQVGAVVTDNDYAIKAVGWNNPPQGQTPCLLRHAGNLIEANDTLAYSDYELTNEKFRTYAKENLQSLQTHGELAGRKLPYCFKDIQNKLEGEKNQVHTRALHAEENAFLQISKYGGEGLKRGHLFTTASPCELCSKKAYQLGIEKIYYIDPYPGIAEKHLLKSGRQRPDLILFDGAIGRAYQQLFEPLMPYKEELEILLDFKFPDVVKSKEQTRELALEEELKSVKAELIELQQWKMRHEE
jgi:deoxycytidylate deaminase